MKIRINSFNSINATRKEKSFSKDSKFLEDSLNSKKNKENCHLKTIFAKYANIYNK